MADKAHHYSPRRLVAVLGPTGVGKTALSIRLAKALGTHIISCDSKQFYRGMTIGTATPTPDELQQVPHHFVQHLEPTDDYSAGAYERDFMQKTNTLFQTYDTAIITGGSGLYAKAAVEGLDEFPRVSDQTKAKVDELYHQHGVRGMQAALTRVDPAYAEVVDMSNSMRLRRALEVSWESGEPYSSFLRQKKKERSFECRIFVLDMDRQELYDRINARVVQMIQSGWIEEVKQLWPYRHTRPMQAIGYPEIVHYLESGGDLDTLIADIQQQTRRYAKRQLTWFRKVEGATFVPIDEAYQMILNRLT